MIKNPVVNAFLAVLYIVGVALIMSSGEHMADGVDSIIVPIAMLSLFVLSASVMGYLFCYQPIQLYLDGHKKEAVNLFLGTVGTFAAITAVLFAILFFLVSAQ